MLETVRLDRKLGDERFRREIEALRLRLGALQRELRERGVAVVILFEGWDAAGKGTIINRLLPALDPRGFSVHTERALCEEERLRPWLWRYWSRTPARGRLAFFDRGWYRPLFKAMLKDRRREAERMLIDAVAFERQLVDDGTLIVKLFLHIDKREQKKRLEALAGDPATAWKAGDKVWKRHRRYERLAAVYDRLLETTGAQAAPWWVVEAHDRNFAEHKTVKLLIAAFETALKAREAASAAPAAEAPAAASPAAEVPASARAPAEQSAPMSRRKYQQRLDEAKDRLRSLGYRIYKERLPVVAMFEGWDAAGKGGAIKRLCQGLDPRGYEVVPVSAPNDVERAHHYLWRFWIKLPKAGHVTVFDRTWYGRVLVERVEGFAPEADWRRAYAEINATEDLLAAHGTALFKFWLEVSPEEQLRRFQAREADQYKKWKITAEDWRNREKRELYAAAVADMLRLTNSVQAPWTVVQADDKLHARIHIMETVAAGLEARLGLS